MDLKEAQLTDFNINNRHPWELARFNIILHFISRIIKKYPDKIFTILDIGCGDTFVISQLSNHFKNLNFLAVDQEFSDDIKKRYQKEYQERNVNIEFYNSVKELNTKSTEAKADIVLLLDVVEHIEDDNTFISELSNHKLISEHTNIIITVPAFQTLFSEHDNFMGHYRRYNQRSLLKLIKRNRLYPQQRGYFFFTLLFARFFSKIKEFIFGPSKLKGVGDYNQNRLFSRLLKLILIIDFRVMFALRKTGIRIPGLSTFVICKKSV